MRHIRQVKFYTAGLLMVQHQPLHVCVDRLLHRFLDDWLLSSCDLSRMTEPRNRIFSMTGRQGTEALAFARRKRSSGPFTSGLTPQDGRDDLQLPGAAVRAPLHVDVKHTLE